MSLSKTTYKFGVLLPVKIEESGALTQDQEKYLPLLAASLLCNHKATVYLGIDKGKEDAPAVQEIKAIFTKIGIDVDTTVFDDKYKGSVCYFWRILSKRAIDDGSDFFCLLGDDVEMDSKGWINNIVSDFEDLHHKLRLPDELFGFGCIALTDKQAPGFPTFPVLHRKHFRLHGNELFSSEFINQDADPFLFQLYRRFGAATYSSRVKLTNHVGGVQLQEDKAYKEPRYDRQHIQWSRERLTSAVNLVSSSLKDYTNRDLSVTTIDIVVPTYRVVRSFLEGVLSLKATRPQVDLNFIIIADDPQADVSWLKEMVQSRTDLRMRVNEVNKGASETRNIGMDESAAEFILFLDDDLYPDDDLVDRYVDAIRLPQGNQYDGFVGYSELPNKPTGIFATAVHFSGVSFFWRAARKMELMPWGITANLLVRRLACPRFDTSFIKTGGGEDIDFCLKLKRFPLLAVPKARILHPWWDNGKRCYRHFFNWSYSDGMLQDKYPKHTYHTAPDAVEFTTASVAVTVAAAVALRQPSLLVMTLLTPLAVLVADTGMDLLEKWPDGEAEPYSRGVYRVAALLESTLIKNYSSLGRLSGHWDRGNLWKNFCKRFDWFCGLDAVVVEGEQKKAFWRFVVYSGMVGLTVTQWIALK